MRITFLISLLAVASAVPVAPDTKSLQSRGDMTHSVVVPASVGSQRRHLETAAKDSRKASSDAEAESRIIDHFVMSAQANAAKEGTFNLRLQLGQMANIVGKNELGPDVMDASKEARRALRGGLHGNGQKTAAEEIIATQQKVGKELPFIGQATGTLEQSLKEHAKEITMLTGKQTHKVKESDPRFPVWAKQDEDIMKKMSNGLHKISTDEQTAAVDASQTLKDSAPKS